MSPRLIIAGASLSVAFLAGWVSNGWRVGLQLAAERTAHTSTREAYQASLANALAEAEIERQRLAQAAREVILARNDEIERLRVAADRVPDTIRVRYCPSVPPATSPVSGDSGDDPSPSRGVVPEGMAEGDRDLDIRRVTELMRRADEVAADLRAVVEICSKP